MLRADLLLRLADHVEKMPKGSFDDSVPGFNMRSWNNCVAQLPDGSCGTASCLGGTAEVLFENEMPGTVDVPDAYQILSTLGGKVYAKPDTSDYKTLRNLFYPKSNAGAWNATPAQAAAVVRYLVESGVVDWDKFVPIPEFRLIPEQLPNAD